MYPEQEMNQLFRNKGIVRAPDNLFSSVEQGIRSHKRKKRLTFFSGLAAAAAIVFLMLGPLSAPPITQDQIRTVEVYLEETFDSFLEPDTAGKGFITFVADNAGIFR